MAAKPQTLSRHSRRSLQRAKSSATAALSDAALGRTPGRVESVPAERLTRSRRTRSRTRAGAQEGPVADRLDRRDVDAEARQVAVGGATRHLERTQGRRPAIARTNEDVWQSANMDPHESQFEPPTAAELDGVCRIRPSLVAGLAYEDKDRAARLQVGSLPTHIDDYFIV